MGTTHEADRLSTALFGKTRRSVLAVLYSHADEEFYLRQLARAAAVGMGAIQREVKNLTDAGVISRTVRGRNVYYRANPRCPIYSELKSLILKTAGIGDLLRASLAPLADRIDAAFICGSVARGKQRRQSDVDVLVIGDATFAEVVSAFGPAQEALNREINPTVYPLEEFRAKLAARHHFLVTVLREPRIFLIGDERELTRLGEKRMAD